MTSFEQPPTQQPSRLTVVRMEQGWEIRERLADDTVRITRHTDWHRVERSLQALALGLLAEIHS